MQTAVIPATPETKRQPEFKVGDKVKLITCDWFGSKYNCEVIMVGEIDTTLAGGEPIDFDNPALVYGYNLRRLDDGCIYIGVPEFYVQPTKKSKR